MTFCKSEGLLPFDVNAWYMISELGSFLSPVLRSFAFTATVDMMFSPSFATNPLQADFFLPGFVNERLQKSSLVLDLT